MACRSGLKQIEKEISQAIKANQDLIRNCGQLTIDESIVVIGLLGLSEGALTIEEIAGELETSPENVLALKRSASMKIRKYLSVTHVL